jgi:hypothetical protein
MKKFFAALHNILLYDNKANRLSHTKMWSNIGYACLCYTFVYAVMFGTTVDVMIWALFGVVVIGNRTVVELFTREPNKVTPPGEES